MWSSDRRRALMPLAAALLVAPACAAPPPRAVATAPGGAPTCAALRAGTALSRVSLFDGSPAEMADLVPDRETTARGTTVSQWNLAGVYRAGRIVHAVCRYGENAPVDVALHQPVKACRLVATADTRTLRCR